jgi:TolA-binding protein
MTDDQLPSLIEAFRAEHTGDELDSDAIRRRVMTSLERRPRWQLRIPWLLPAALLLIGSAAIAGNGDARREVARVFDWLEEAPLIGVPGKGGARRRALAKTEAARNRSHQESSDMTQERVREAEDGSRQGVALPSEIALAVGGGAPPIEAGASPRAPNDESRAPFGALGELSAAEQRDAPSAGISSRSEVSSRSAPRAARATSRRARGATGGVAASFGKALSASSAASTTSDAPLAEEAVATPIAPPNDATRSASKELVQYSAAQRLHFHDKDPARALAAWTAYLAAFPDGELAVDAGYNRALCLIKLGRVAEAEKVLERFASGAHGAYRRTEASALLEMLRRRAVE